MTESDSEGDGYVSSDSQSDFDEADTRASRASLAPIAGSSSAGPSTGGATGGARQVHVAESDSDDESSRSSSSSTDEVRLPILRL